MSSRSSRSGRAIAPTRKRWRGGIHGSETTMSADESFLTRWARRKRGAAQNAPAGPTPKKAEEGAASKDAAASLRPEDAQSPFDPRSSPPIESIGVGSDIRPFLA